MPKLETREMVSPPAILRREEPFIREESFAYEIASALEFIETLTKDECAYIIRAMMLTNCEPMAAFLALHATLSSILASQRSGEFQTLLRSWGANRLLDSVIWKHWSLSYRPKYRSGCGISGEGIATLLKKENDFDMICVRPNPIAEALRNQRGKRVRADITVGDVFHYRMTNWSDREWSSEFEVFEISSVGSLLCRKPGGKTKRTFTKRCLGDSRFEIEIIRKVPEGPTSCPTGK